MNHRQLGAAVALIVVFTASGAAAQDARDVVAVGGHFIPRELLIRETVEWFDRYLGRPPR